MPVPQLLCFFFRVLTGLGQSSLPQACPVCLHEPVKADDCRPNKALRTTIKVFLRKKGIEREAARKKELLEKIANSSTSSANAPIDQQKQPSPPQVSANSVSENGEPNGVGTLAPRRISNLVEPTNGSSSLHAPQTSPAEDHMDIPRPSIEVSAFLNLVRRLLMLISLPMTDIRKKVRTIKW